MPTVTFIDHTGQEHNLAADDYDNLMEVAVDNDLPGIDADCGGSCACATCHVYVEEEFLDAIPEMSEAEKDMLDLAEQRKANSRLACQLPIIDGIRVTMPEEQF